MLGCEISESCDRTSRSVSFGTEKSAILAGWAGHRFKKYDGKWKISAKQVNLLQCDQCIRNPSIIL